MQSSYSGAVCAFLGFENVPFAFINRNLQSFNEALQNFQYFYPAARQILYSVTKYACMQSRWRKLKYLILSENIFRVNWIIKYMQGTFWQIGGDVWRPQSSPNRTNGTLWYTSFYYVTPYILCTGVHTCISMHIYMYISSTRSPICPAGQNQPQGVTLRPQGIRASPRLIKGMVRQPASQQGSKWVTDYYPWLPAITNSQLKIFGSHFLFAP